MKDMIILAVAVPLLMAFLLPTLSAASYRIAALLAPLTLVGLLFLSFCTWNFNSEPIVLYLGNFVAPLGIAFYIDGLALILSMAIAVFSLLLWPWFADKGDSAEAKTRRFSLLLLLVASANGLAFSGDLFNLYVFYELLAVASYGLVAVSRPAHTGAGFAAAFRYLIISATGSVMALTGIALVYFLTGTLNFAHLAIEQAALLNPIGLTAFVLLLIGFGVKAELFPVNSWVPEVYQASSRRLAALLAGVVSKLAVLVIVKALLFIYPQDDARQFLLILGLVGVVLGEMSALRATDFTRLLSWSSIGQLGLVFVAFSIPGKAGLVAGLAIVFHHMLTKPILFLIAEQWGGQFSLLKGQGKYSPFMAVLLILVALSMVGVPPLPGFWAKFLLLTALAEQAQYLAIALILVMTVVEAFYFFRVVNQLFAVPEEQKPRRIQHGFIDGFTAMLLGAVLLFAVSQLQLISVELDSMAAGLMDVSGYVSRVMGVTGGSL